MDAGATISVLETGEFWVFVYEGISEAMTEKKWKKKRKNKKQKTKNEKNKTKTNLFACFCWYGFHQNDDNSTTVPRACSTVLPHRQRIKTEPQSPEHTVLAIDRESRQDHSPQSIQFCPIDRESRQNHSPQIIQFCPIDRESRQDHSPQSIQLCPIDRESRQDHSPQSIQFCPLVRVNRFQSFSAVKRNDYW